jgi:hypothetical protein
VNDVSRSRRRDARLARADEFDEKQRRRSENDAQRDREVALRIAVQASDDEAKDACDIQDDRREDDARMPLHGRHVRHECAYGGRPERVARS